MKRQAIRLLVMGAIDVILAILFGIYGVSALRNSDFLLAIFIVWLMYNFYELILPVSSN
jgi:hypothetical protein